jgi:hypothetical protein
MTNSNNDRRSASALFWKLSAILLLVTISSTRAADVALRALPGHVPNVVRQLAAKGNLPATNRLNLTIGIPLRDPKGLDAFLSQLYDPASPNYHHYLTPAQFTAAFGPTEAEYNAVAAFARQNNLAIANSSESRLIVDVSGAVADVEKAFHIRLRSYAHPTEARDFYSPDTDPTIDASLPIADVSGLDNYVLPHPRFFREGAHARANAIPRNGSGTGGTYLGKDFRAAYVPGESLTGAGQTVGLLEFDGFYATDIAGYERTAGYASVPIKTVLLDGYDGTPTTGSDSGNPEVSLDIEMAVALAPGLSQIVSFEAGPSGSPLDMLDAMAASNQIKQFSCSWGWGGGPTTTLDTIFKKMATQGQSFFTAAGDSDAFTVGASSVNGVDNVSLFNTPSSSPYITTVGGTTLSTTGPGGSWKSETVWNWGVIFETGTSEGTSGGVSSHYALPSWQSGISMTANKGSTTFRNIPDVALTGDNIYVVYGNGSFDSFGGTSCAAPLWAALAALMNQQAAATSLAPIGFINPAIYAIGKGASYSSAFHDITTGNNFSANSPANYSAVAGYDLCSGWGTPIGKALINAMVGVPDSLEIFSGVSLTANGPVGGPFNPVNQTIVLTNVGSTAVNWVVSAPNWLTVAPTSGTLAAHATANVEVELTDGAADFNEGIYATNISFENQATKIAQPASMTLLVGQSIVQNGGFETGDFTAWTLVGATTVGHGRGGVTVYDAVENTNSGYDVVHTGSYGAFMGDNALATLSQTISTVAGQSYQLSIHSASHQQRHRS